MTGPVTLDAAAVIESTLATHCFLMRGVRMPPGCSGCDWTTEEFLNARAAAAHNTHVAAAIVAALTEAADQ